MHPKAPDAVQESGDEARVALRVGRAERDRLSRLAELHDRTLSGEVRRAIRAYLLDPDAADRALRDQPEPLKREAERHL